MFGPGFFIVVASIILVVEAGDIQRRGLPGAVYTCTSIDFRGDCAWSAPTDRCREQGPEGLGIQSIGPDPGGHCTLYQNFDCTGDEVQTVRFPGIQSNIPTFAAFKCLVDNDGPAAKGSVIQSEQDLVVSYADPRLAGGVGSAERTMHRKEIEAMERDGFKEGLIGYRKGVYY